ncbi:hypothetical protein JDV09_13395 [Mycobacterium sp. Y57]|uniref:hypothetical protein n=1 Tax=Mycolicibacterium xanthum TaxID=2796469 RepID=UPI001C859B0D|nr:hypothetical protein [Mycolicibacterium xanthum]MBX7433096.1 hypothetical protein [Mycolicibacterium xanthum]
MFHPLELTTDDGELLTDLESINRFLAWQHSKVWPLDLGDLPPEVRVALDTENTTSRQAELVLRHFLLPRDRLLGLIAECGREPQVPGGGALETHVLPHDYDYPHLFEIHAGDRITTYDVFHSNRAEDGTGVDEIVQMLRGQGLLMRHRLPDGAEWSLRMSCPGPEQGWLSTYEGSHPHIGSPADAAAGSKFLVQVIGPPIWTMEYLD